MSRAPARRRRRIAVVTGTRAEYGVLKSTLDAIAADARLELRLIVAGMHLLRKFGHTIDDIVRDGWPIAARVPMQRGDDDPCDQAAGLARGISAIGTFLHADRADIVVVLGDRIEALAGALAAVTTGRVLAHIHGGDVAQGDFDDSLRHAITKLAHVHFAATRAAGRRIVRMGEDPHRVHVVGAPGLDRLRELQISAAHVGQTGSPAPRPVENRSHNSALVVYHAWGRPVAAEYRTMTTLLHAVAAHGLHRLIVWPNTDRGHAGVLRAIDEHARASGGETVRVLRSLPRDDYLRLLMRANVLVGNSSSGIIEAPLAGTPSVNVGPRQAGRQPGGPSVLNCGESCNAIRAALARALRMRRRPPARTVYGVGRAGAHIARVLATLPLTDATARKIIAYSVVFATAQLASMLSMAARNVGSSRSTTSQTVSSFTPKYR